MSRILKRLNSIHNSNILQYDQLVSMENKLSHKFDELKKVTENLKGNQEPEVGAWRKVPDPTVSEEAPLVQSDVEQFLKRLDVI